MDEVGVQPGLAGLDVSEYRTGPNLLQIVPAHMGYFQRGILRFNRRDIAGDPVQALGDFIFEAARGHQLHADADAKERPAAAAHRLLKRLDHATDRIKAAPAIGESPDAG